MKAMKIMISQLLMVEKVDKQSRRIKKSLPPLTYSKHPLELFTEAEAEAESEADAETED